MSSCFASFRSIVSVVFVWRELAGQSAWGGSTVREAQTVRGARSDRSFFKVLYWRFYCYFRTVRSRVADRPPGVFGPSAPAWCLAELLSPLLLEFHFSFGIVWGLFLGLVGSL
jgi:hypothetical protein